MGIVFRHDAAAVALPANGNRKYGQQLVLQQNQQKYQAQQAGYDRLLQVGRDAQQNAFQAGRDFRQQAFIAGRDKAQNDFQVGRDKVLFEQQQQMQRAKDFEAARSRIDTHAKDMLANGEIKDPAARQRIQNLIAGKTIVMGSGFDETARQSYLDQYNAELAKILSEVPPPRPQPSAQEQFEQSVITDPQTGMRYVPNAKGGLEPLPESKQRPKSFQDYYSENEDKFQKDLNSTMDAMQVPDKDGNVPDVTPEKALEKMQKDYDFRQKALGRPQYGTPTDAPSMQGTAPAAPGQSRSILESSTPQNPMAQLPDPGMPPAPTPAATYGAQMAGQGYKLTTPESGGNPYYYKDATPLTANRPDAGMPPSPNQWAGVVQPQSANQTQTVTAAPSKPVALDFGAMASGAKNEADRAFINKMQEVHQGQSPDVQAAIGVLLSPSTSDRDAAQALMYLKSKGIDVEQLMATQKSDDMVYPSTGLM